MKWTVRVPNVLHECTLQQDSQRLDKKADGKLGRKEGEGLYSFAKEGRLTKEKARNIKRGSAPIKIPKRKQERQTSMLKNEREEMPAGYDKEQRKGNKAFCERPFSNQKGSSH